MSTHVLSKQVTTNVVRFRGVNSDEIVSGIEGVLVYWDFNTMEIEAKNSGPSQLFGFKGILVYFRF